MISVLMSSSKLSKIPINPMLNFLISCVPLIFLSQSLTQITLQLCETLINLLSIFFIVSCLNKNSHFPQLGSPNSLRKTLTMTLHFLTNTSPLSARSEPVIERSERAISLLDLPDLTLDLVFERLSPAGLRSMAGVCSSLRERCISDHLWERHLERKWGRVIGESGYRLWKCELGSRNCGRECDSGERKRKGLIERVLGSKPFSWFVGTKVEMSPKKRTNLAEDSVMAWFLALESGKFWFPAQVFNRENGHVGFMLSCYDAQLCYDSSSDTFEARYFPHGRRTIEDNIEWDRLRAPPVDTPPYVLHVSDCLNELKPGDHIEIQWRRNKEFPYGWWYGLVGHLETCDGNESLCRCQCSDTIALEFKQYNPGSRWRRTMVNRKDHREEGNEVDGFYGGIRKLSSDEEISQWKRFWPTQVLEQ